jgi:hypothetical protein
VWWQCPNRPRHRWRTAVSSRTGGGRMTGCPLCRASGVPRRTGA